MIRYYMTLGSQYSYMPHPKLPKRFSHPDGVLEVLALNQDDAKSLIATKVGINDYSSLYGWEEGPDPIYYPLGVTGVLWRAPSGRAMLTPLEMSDDVVNSLRTRAVDVPGFRM